MASILLFISFSETLVVLLAAWLLLGTKRLPDTARMLGKGLREFRKATADIKKELADTPIDVVNREVRSISSTLTRSLDPDAASTAAAPTPSSVAARPSVHEETPQEKAIRLQHEADSFAQYYAASAAADATAADNTGAAAPDNADAAAPDYAYAPVSTVTTSGSDLFTPSVPHHD